ncbi:STAS/SEC14 domain-containing protein [Chondromyces crocatus]|uniref:STAS/SEC14 domain-containing protein n=1 Tax=Chondromyces crocatus TaxID=52 RepID=A0A0K1ECD2_CHOCO|nr:STAS/SEC14 domain-containing protein [Chondromyces crocatus]AKT38223.1 uncharacterized protein CMC5_023660 [Chondromyces crocatus]
MWLEPPDLVCVVAGGDVAPEELRSTILLEGAVGRACGRVFLLVDMSGMGIMESDARKMVRHAVDIPFRGIAVYGAGFKARVLVKMLAAALQLFSPGVAKFLSFFSTEEEARRWLFAQRALVDAEHARVVSA